MIDEQLELWQPQSRVWRVTTNRDFTEPGVPRNTISLSTTDDDFTRDARTTIEYYSSHLSLDQYAHKDQYVRECMSFAQSIMDNDEEFSEPERWFVRQIDQQEDRLIMHRFSGVPLPFFWKLWRRPLIPQNIYVERADVTSALVRFSYFEENDPLMAMAFECYLDWDGLFDNLKEKKPHRRIPDWWKTMHGRLFLFSDYDTVFEDEQDEVAYLTDFMR